MNNDQKVEMMLSILLNEVKDKLPKNDTKNIMEFIANSEWGLAYETLCIQLYEYDVQISSEFYEKISSCGKLIDIQAYIWLPLKELIR